MVKTIFWFSVANKGFLIESLKVKLKFRVNLMGIARGLGFKVRPELFIGKNGFFHKHISRS